MMYRLSQLTLAARLIFYISMPVFFYLIVYYLRDISRYLGAIWYLFNRVAAGGIL